MYKFEELDTKQKVFDYIVKKLYNQNGPSISGSSGGCALRGFDNRKCAVGHIIPSNLYKEYLEECSVMNSLFIDNFKSDRFKSFLTENLKILKDLQDAHDQLTYIGNADVWKSTIVTRFNYVAKEHGLKQYSP